MPSLIFIVIMALAGVMLVGKFGGPRRAGESDAAWEIRRNVCRALKIIGLILLVPALLSVIFVALFMGGGR